MGMREIQQGPPPMAYLSQAGQGLSELAQAAGRNRQIDPAKLHRLISRVMNGEDPVDVARQHKIEEHLSSQGQGSGMGAPDSPEQSPQGAPPPSQPKYPSFGGDDAAWMRYASGGPSPSRRPCGGWRSRSQLRYGG
jgi:hypothetical protein